MRLLIVDDHEVVRRGVRSLLLEQPEIDVCGEAVDGQDALDKARELKPDLILMDVSMPRLNGLEATRQVRSIVPDSEVLILSQHENPEMARQALKAGARGYVVKGSISKDLISAVKKVSRREYFFDPAILDQTPSAHVDIQEILKRSAGLEEALRQSEQLYRSTFELAAVGVAHVSPEGRWLRVNRKLCEIVGYSEPELLRLTFQDITHPDDLATDLAQTEKVRSGKLGTYSLQKRYIRKDGSLVWINLTVSGVPDARGNFHHFISVIEDVSERRHVEEALHHSQQDLALALESSRTAMFDWDVIQKRGEWNSEMAAIYGFRPKNAYITAAEWASLFHPDDRQRLVREAEQVWKGGEEFTFEFRTVRSTSEIKWILSHGRIVRDAEGKAVRMIGTHKDITDRKRIEQALQARQAELNEAQRLAKIGSWHWTPKTDTVTWSEELYRIAERDPKSSAISYQDHHALYTPESWSRLQSAVDETLKEGTGYSVELELIRPDGTKRWVVANGEAERDMHGAVASLRGTVQDITDRKRTEEELRRNEERTRFSLEAANIGTWEWDVRTGQVRWSSNMESVHGQPPGSFSASFDSFQQGVFVEDREKVEQQIKLALSGEGKYKVEYRQYRSDGSLGWMEANGQVVFDADGQPSRMLGICSDVTERKTREQALRDSEGRFRAIVDTTPECVKLVAPDGTLLHMNSSGLQMVGAASAEAVAGMNVYDLIAPEDRERFRAFNEKVCAGEKGSLEFDIVRLDGTRRHMETHAAPLRNPDGSMVHLAITADITQRKRAEEATGLLSAIVASSEDAIISKTLDGIITSWNAGAERLFGYSAEEAIGQHITLVIPEERQSEEVGILDRLRRGERVDHFHTVRRRKDGTLFDVSLSISPVRNSSGKISGASKVVRDITAQKRAEQELRESEQRFRVITDASPVMVWMAGTDKLCYYFNKGWLDFVGRTLEQESGNGWAENVHPEDFERCLQIYVSNFDARRSFEMEYRMRHHTGQYRWILDRGVPRYSADGAFEGYVGGCLDIHYQKEAAEKVRIADETVHLMKIQDEERRRIARELHDSAGQTLTVLGMSIAQLVQRAEAISPELAQAGKEIEGVAQQLSREIRTTSYLLHPPLLDELGLSSALNWYVEGLAQRSGIAIKLDIPDNFGRLPSDMELAIFRLVQECLTNIHRHSGSKTASIRLFVDAGSLHVEVSDQGKGIPPERLAEIRSGGSGVGIRGMLERLRQFGGELSIDANDRGTRVTANLPTPNEVVPIQNDQTILECVARITSNDLRGSSVNPDLGYAQKSENA